MQHKLTITVDEKVYQGLHKKIGRGKISKFLENLARPYLFTADLEAEYRLMAADKEREKEAREWTEAHIDDGLNDETW